MLSPDNNSSSINQNGNLHNLTMVNPNKSKVQSKQSQRDEGTLRGYVVCSKKDLCVLPHFLFFFIFLPLFAFSSLFVILQANYFEDPSGTPTGTCGVLIVGGERYGLQASLDTVRQKHIEKLGSD